MYFRHFKAIIQFLVNFNKDFTLKLPKLLLISTAKAPPFGGFPQRSAASDPIFSLYFELKRRPEMVTTTYFCVFLLYKFVKLVKITT